MHIAPSPTQKDATNQPNSNFLQMANISVVEKSLSLHCSSFAFFSDSAQISL